ncbi:MAG: class I SAM-dependent methyltransferase [Candidatus Thorarchaeota archaeon]
MQPRPTNLASSGVEKIIKRLKEIPGGKILDVGTGRGDFIEFLHKALKNHESSMGIDISKKELEKARKRHGKIAKFSEMNAENLDFTDNTFGVVSIASSLHHLEKPERVLQEMFRVLKTDGYLIIQEMYSDLDQTNSQITASLIHHFTAKIDTILGEYHRRTYTRHEIKQLLNRIKLKEIEIFDTTRYPTCFFCEEKEKCDNPMEESFITTGINDLKSSLEKIENQSEYKKYKKEADELEEKIKETGYSDASILFILAKK